MQTTFRFLSDRPLGGLSVSVAKLRAGPKTRYALIPDARTWAQRYTPKFVHRLSLQPVRVGNR